jgi:TonB-dependent receptor
MKKQKIRAIALASSGMALAMMGHASVHARDAQAQPGTTAQEQEEAPVDPNTIVVEGIRQQLLRAAQLEREADNIVSVITADDLGQFPDETFAESLARLPGVTVIEEEGEGRFIRVRGLSEDYSQVTLNNAQLGSSDINGSRSVALDVIPSDLFSSAEVGKTLFPDTDHDSLGAKVDLRPLSAFDRSDDATMRLIAQGTYSEFGRLLSPRISGDFTRRFDLGGGELGIAGGISFQRRDVFGDRLRSQSGNGISQIQANVEGGLLYRPDEIDVRLERGARERLGGTLTIDFENDVSRYKLTGVIGTLKDDDRRFAQEVELADSSNGESVNEAPGSGRFSDLDIQRQVFFLPSEETTWAVHFEGQNDFGDDAWTLSYALDYSRNDFSIEQGTRAQWELNAPARSDSVVDAVWNRTSADFTYVGNGDLDGSFDLNFVPTMGNFGLTQLLILEEDRTDEVYSGNIDLERRFEAFGRPVAIKTGAKYRERSRNFLRGEFVASLTDADRATLRERGIATDLGGDVELFSPRTSLPLDGGVEGLDGFPSFGFANRLIGDFLDRSEIALTEARVDFSGAEETWAGYVMATIDVTPDLTLVTGVRYEHTRYEATGVTRQDAELSVLDGFDVDGNPIEAVEVFGRAGTGEQDAIETIPNTYGDWFPALHLRWDAADDLVLRLGLSRAQVRPSFGDANALTQTFYRLAEPEFGRLDQPGTCLQPVTATVNGAPRQVCPEYQIETRGGNPNLQPLLANQFDINLGWYPNKSTNLTAAFFYKDLENVFIEVDTVDPEIISQISPLDSIDPLTGLAVTRLTQIINASSGFVYGLELGGNHSFTYLPGPLKHLFVDGNVTFLRGETQSFAVRGGEAFELPNQPRLIGNLGIGYEDKKFTLRATIDYAGQLLRSVDAADPARDILNAERFRLGLAARYNITRDFRLFANVANITNEAFNAFYRSDALSGPVFEEFEQFGRTWRLGVNLRF